jgi:pimeloyl-ACP methyl ester carboxylesterase
MTIDQNEPFESPQPGAGATAAPEEIDEPSAEDVAPRRRRGWRRWAIGAVAVAAIAAGALFVTGRDARGEESDSEAAEGAAGEDGEEDKEKAPIPVEVAVVATGPVASYIAATANLVAEGEVKVLAEVEGRVTRILAAEGDWLDIDERRTFVGWMKARLALDPAALLAKAPRIPTAVFHGLRDDVVPPAHAALQAAVDPANRVGSLEGLDHHFRRPGGPVDADFLKALVDAVSAK